jgi:pSer/pThr/pTyr-binding forkhead associated (FHA) protein
VVAPPVAPSPAPAGAGPRLVVKDTGAVCPLPHGRDVIVGRIDPIDGIFPDVDLTPHDTLTGVSRRHAKLHEQGGQWFIRDLNSTNYTIVNRQRLQPDQDFLIEPGDEIRFGRLTMLFQV